ncbi:MAG: capsid protein, partial [Oscillospiraceae bacterium]
QELLKKRGLETNGCVQIFVDNETMKLMEPYMPFETGMMAHSMPTATIIGSGEVHVNTPYAHRRLLSARNNGLRGPNYFARMKADRLNEILDGAAKMAGAKGKK